MTKWAKVAEMMHKIIEALFPIFADSIFLLVNGSKLRKENFQLREENSRLRERIARLEECQRIIRRILDDN